MIDPRHLHGAASTAPFLNDAVRAGRNWTRRPAAGKIVIRRPLTPGTLIKGIGIDLVEVERFRRGHREGDIEFTEEVFTPAEVSYCRSQARYWEHFAARFAAKEAAFKALGAGLNRGLTWRMVEVVRDSSGAVFLVFSGRATELARTQGVTRIHLTLTHTEHTAAAVVVLEGRD